MSHSTIDSGRLPFFRRSSWKAPDLVREMVGNRELQEVTRDSLVSQDRPGILDGGADIEVGAPGFIGRNEVETAGIGVVEARGVHETARAGRLERRRQLADGE